MAKPRQSNEDRGSSADADTHRATDGPAAIIQQVEDREAVLLASADLFEEIAAFMDTITPRTFADYEAAPTEKQKGPLRLKHREAMRVRDDYRMAAKENRDDAALYASLRASGEV